MCTVVVAVVEFKLHNTPVNEPPLNTNKVVQWRLSHNSFRQRITLTNDD